MNVATSRLARRTGRTETTEEPATRRGASRTGRAASTTKEPARTRTSHSAVASGWGSVEKFAAKDTKFTKDFNPGEEKVVMKFLEEEPFAIIRQHWITKAPKQKSWLCIAEDEDCPLCDQGDNPSTLVKFNVVDFSDADNPVLRTWSVYKKVSDVIKNFADDKKTTPLNRDDLYFAVARTGKKGSWSTNLEPIKERDLEDDWDVVPLDADETAEFVKKALSVDDIEYPELSELRDIARLMADD